MLSECGVMSQAVDERVQKENSGCKSKLNQSKKSHVGCLNKFYSNLTMAFCGIFVRRED